MGITGRTFSITSYTARFKKNDSNSGKTYTAKFNVGDGKVHTFTITQDGKETAEKVFNWSNGQTSIDKEVDSTTKSIQEFYNMSGYTLSDLTVVCDTSGCTGRLDSSGIFIGNITNNKTNSAVTIVFGVVYNDEVIATLTVEQDGKEEEKYFWLVDDSGNTVTAYTTDLLDATTTSINVGYLTNYTQEELGELISASTQDWIKSTLLNSGIVTVTIDSNETTDNRTGIVNIKNGFKILGSIIIKQNGCKMVFNWNNEQSGKTLLNFTATTFSEQYTTNYNNLTIEYSDNVSTATLTNVNGSGIANGHVNINQETSAVTSYVRVKSNGVLVGLLTIVQPAAEEKYFWVYNSGTTDYSIPEFEADASCAQTPYEVAIFTNRNDIKFEIGGFLDTVTLNDDLTKVLFTFRKNTGVERSAKISFYTGNSLTTATTLGSISLKQSGAVFPKFYWFLDGFSGSSLDITVPANITEYDEVTYYSTYSEELSLSADNNYVITAFTPTALTSTELGAFHFSFNENMSTVSNQVGYIRVRDRNNSLVGLLKLIQSPKENINEWFRWVINMDSQYTVPNAVAKEGGEFSFQFETNISTVSFRTEASQDWFSVQPENKESSCHFVLTQNDEEQTRTIIIFAHDDDTQQDVGKLTIVQQSAPVEKYIWIEQMEQSAITYDAPYTATSTNFSIKTNYSQTELNNLIKTTNPSNVGWVKNITLNKTSLTFSVEKNEDKNNTRSCEVIIKNFENVELIKVTVNQEKNDDREFKWLDGSITALTATTIHSESGETPGIDVTVRYETDYDEFSAITENEWIENVIIDTSINAVKYHLDVPTTWTPLAGTISLFNKTKLIGKIYVEQEPAPEPGKYFKFEYNGEIITSSTLEINNVPATLTGDTCHFVVSALTNFNASLFTLEIDGALGSGWITNLNKGNVDPETGFTIMFDVGNNSDTRDRTGLIYIKKDGSVYRTIRVVQNQMTYDFSWEESTIVSGKTIGPLSTGATSNTIPFYSNYPNISIVTAVTDGGITCVMNGGNSVRYNTTARGQQEYSIRSATFNLISNNTNIIGSLVISQSGQTAPLTFNWDTGRNYKEITVEGNSSDWDESYTASSRDYLLYLFPDTNNPTGATPTGKTYMSISRDGFTGSTNFTVSAYEEATNTPRVFTFYVKANTTDVTYDSPTYGTYKVTQLPKPYFYWGSAGTDTGTTYNILVTGTPVTGTTIPFRTNYNTNNLTITPSSSSVFNNASIDGTNFCIWANENQEIAEKEQIYSIMNGSTKIGEIKITQNGAPAIFEWNDAIGDKSNYSIPNQPLTGTSYSTLYKSNYLNIQLVTAGTPSNFITSPNINTDTKVFSCTIKPSDEIQVRSYTFSVCGQTTTSSSSSRVIGTITINQTAAEPRFKWTINNNSSYDGAQASSGVEWSTRYTYDTNYSGLSATIVSGAEMVSDGGMSFYQSQFYILTTRNETQSTRQAKFNIMSENSLDPIGDITFTQAAPPQIFYWGSNTSNTATTMDLKTKTTGSSSYTTTYTDLTLTYVSGDDILDNYSFGYSFYVTANTNTSENAKEGVYKVRGKWNGTYEDIGSLTLKQDAGKVFKWTANSESEYSIELDWDTPSISQEYINTYNLNSTVYSSKTATWITSKSLSNRTGNGTFTCNVGNNTTGDDRDVSLYIRTGSTAGATVGTLNITQKKQPIVNTFSWRANEHVTNDTGDNIDGTGSTETQNYYVTGYTGLSCSSNQTWLKCEISNTSGSGTLTYSAATQSEGASSRSGVITISSNGTGIGTLNVTQDGRSIIYTLAAYVGTSGQETSANVVVGGGSVTIRVQSNQSWTGSSNQTWAMFGSSQTKTGSNNDTLTLTVSSNDGGDERDATITFTGEHSGTAIITVNQAGTPKEFKWSNGDTAYTTSTYSFLGNETVNVSYTTNYTGMQITPTTSTHNTGMALTNPDGSGSFTATTKENTSTVTAPSDTFKIYTGDSSSNVIGQITIKQEVRPGSYVVVLNPNTFSVTYTDGDAALVVLKSINIVCSTTTGASIDLSNQEIDVGQTVTETYLNPNTTLFTFSTNPNNRIINATLNYTVDGILTSKTISTTISGMSITNKTFVYPANSFEFEAYT